ncbi:integral membrane protein S linking to the trans Golgi network-domain-containing protein [Irpex lacteus]|nr:integral membrane protein S linking to the trans Golgi network-domain-containing protein [Irpex lacteus]
MGPCIDHRPISPLLSLFANPGALEYEGGAANVGMIMDWRQMAGKPTTGASLADTWKSLHSVWSGGHQVLSGDNNGSGSSSQQGSAGGGTWSGQMDPRRGWIIAICWLATCGADITYLYHLIRRPRLILDFTLTLLFNHLVLTTYYSSALPSSIFFWAVMAIGAAGTVIVAEQVCVKREMEEGLKVSVGSGAGGGTGEDGDEIEMGGLLRHD